MWRPLCDIGSVSPSTKPTSLDRGRWQKDTSATLSEKSAITSNVHCFFVTLAAQMSSCFIMMGRGWKIRGFSPDFETSFELVLINRTVTQHNCVSVLLE